MSALTCSPVGASRDEPQRQGLDKLKHQRLAQIRSGQQEYLSPAGRYVEPVGVVHSSNSQEFVIGAHPGTALKTSVISNNDSQQQPAPSEIECDADSGLQEQQAAVSDICAIDLPEIEPEDVVEMEAAAVIDYFTGRHSDSSVLMIASLAAKLNAVKQASAMDTRAVAMLIKKLRQTTAQLVFHQANARPNSVSLFGANRAPSGNPWIPINGTLAGSKHRLVQTAEPRPAPRPSARALSRHTSEKQIVLLTNLQARLRALLAVTIMRQTAEQSAVRKHLLKVVEISEVQKKAKAGLEFWREDTVPTGESLVAAIAFQRDATEKLAKEALQHWHSTAQYLRWRGGASAQGQLLHRKYILTAAFSHWKLFYRLEQAERLQNIVASRFRLTWALRKSLTHWQLITRKTSRIALAFMKAIPGENQKEYSQLAMELETRPATQTVMQALEAHSLGLRPLAEVAGEAVADVKACLEAGGLRWHSDDLVIWEEKPMNISSTNTNNNLELVEYDVIAKSDTTGAAVTMEKTNKGGAQLISSLLQPSSPIPTYDPAAYSSPVKKKRKGAVDEGDEIAAVGTELVWVRGARHQAEIELTTLHKDMAEFKTQCERAIEEYDACNQDVAHRKTATAAATASLADSENALATAQQSYSTILNQHRRAVEQLEEFQAQMQTASDSLMTASAAVDESSRRQAATAAAIISWADKTDAAARELSSAPRGRQSVAAVKLREAQQRLVNARTSSAALQESHPPLEEALKEARAILREIEAQEAAAQRNVAELSQQLQQAEQDVAATEQAKALAAQCLETERTGLTTAEKQLKQHHQMVCELEYRLDDVSQRCLRAKREIQLLTERQAELEHVHEQLVEDDLVAKRGLRQPYNDDDDGQQVLEGGFGYHHSDFLHDDGFNEDEEADIDALQDDYDDGACAIDQEEINLHNDVDPNEDVEQHAGVSPKHAQQELMTRLNPAFLRFDAHAAAQLFYTRRLLLRVMRALEADVAYGGVLNELAGLCMAHQRLPAVLASWRCVSHETKEWVLETSEDLKRKACFRAWLAITRREESLRTREKQFVENAKKKKVQASFAAWRVEAHQSFSRRKIQDKIEQARQTRLLQHWKSWAANKSERRELETLATQGANYRRLVTAWNTWRENYKAVSLLRRVFSQAIDRWTPLVGVNAHINEYNLLVRSLGAWQLAMLTQQEERRQTVLLTVAHSFRKRRLMLAGFVAMRRAAEEKKELNALKPLRGAIFLAWRLTAAGAGGVKAKKFSDVQLKKRMFQAWKNWTDDANQRLICYWLTWHVSAPLRKSLLVWHAMTASKGQLVSTNSTSSMRRSSSTHRQNNVFEYNKTTPLSQLNTSSSRVANIITSSRRTFGSVEGPARKKFKAVVGGLSALEQRRSSSAAAVASPSSPHSDVDDNALVEATRERAAAWKSVAEKMKLQHDFY